jgi:hypothetical protein
MHKQLERLIRTFKKKHDHNEQLRILWSSENQDVARMLDWFQALGSQGEGENGEIFIQLHDTIPNKKHMLKATLLEELGHVLQMQKYGKLSMVADDEQRNERELEIAECMLERSTQLKLSDDDIQQYQRAITVYGKN